MDKIVIPNATKFESYQNHQDMTHAVAVDVLDTSKTSDGYHTFGELYEHRITLYIALCKTLIAYKGATNREHAESLPVVWRSKKHSDGELAFGGEWFVLGIGEKSGEQITYHLPIAQWEKTEFAKTLEQAPEFDGHTPSDVLERMQNMYGDN
jgi:hypothetical protein